MRPPALCAVLLAASVADAASISFATLTEGATLSGFKATSLYLDDADRPFGARFQHEKTGFTLDLVQLQSVPQAFLYVNTYPTSNMGEPHTQEHLLLAKGNVGRALAESTDMTLTGFTAFTAQWRTCYPFHTTAGAPVFYQQMERFLDAMLHPDYSDEEIRREVRNFGVSEDPATHKLRIEEKGTVYNEMVSTSRQQGWVLYKTIFQQVYGKDHPLALNSGGDPSGIREMVPADIRKFHREHYFLGNMGAVVSLPKSEELGPALAQLDGILKKVQPEQVKLPVQSEATLPAMEAGPAGQIAIREYPAENEKQPGNLAFAWPATRNLSPREATLLELFLDNFASDATSNLYALLVNGKTRKLDIGARGVSNHLSHDKGNLIAISVSNVAVSSLTEPKIAGIRGIVLDELARIAAWPDGSQELREFQARLKGRIVQNRRGLGKFANSPPGFGFRGGNSFWMEHLDFLNREPGFKKSLTMKADYDAIEVMLSGESNLWRDRLKAWQLTGITPYAVATRPNPALLKTESEQQAARASTEAERLMAEYKLADRQEALQRYKHEYDARTVELEKLASHASGMKFIEHPPLTLDDQLDYRVGKVGRAIPMVASTFDNMSSASVGLAIRLDGTPESELFLLSILPSLLTGSGVIVDGKAISYEEMQELLRKEILSLGAGFAADLTSNRVELVVQGSGNDLAESARAIEWMKLALLHPNWQAGNLSRLRDLVDQSLSAHRSAMQRSEEGWVRNPFGAYYKQSDPLFLTTQSFLTQAHNVDRLRWMLRDAGNVEERAAVAGFLTALEKVEGDRAARKGMLTAIENGAASGTPAGFDGLSGKAKDTAIEVAKDLQQLLVDLPDATLAGDWRYLCARIREDLAVGPEAALARLEALRAGLVKSGKARMWMVGSSASQQKLTPALEGLAGNLQSAPGNGVKYGAGYGAERRVDARLREHQAVPGEARFVGLLAPNLEGGVLQTQVPLTGYSDTSREALLRYLAFKVFGGGGAHSVFTKTIGAGLAYSNGIGNSPRSGFATYYAERMPDVSQTLKFAIETIQKGPRESRFTEYVIAQEFGRSNAAGSYESRGRAIADDLADGITPEVVKRFREAVLRLRAEPGLAAELFQRLDSVYGAVLPGYGPKAKDSAGAVYFLIGNEKQFQSLDASVQAREDERVYKLYPRDFWLVQ